MCRALRDFGYEANICTFYFNERAGECADQQHKTYQKLTVLGGLPVGMLSSIKGWPASKTRASVHFPSRDKDVEALVERITEGLRAEPGREGPCTGSQFKGALMIWHHVIKNQRRPSN